jgi:ATP synthase protein I
MPRYQRKWGVPALRGSGSADILAPAMGRPPGSAWEGYSTAWGVIATLVAGIGLWGGLGYLADRLLGLRGVFFAVGIVLGAAGGIYIVYLRYGKGNRGQG